jgi:flagellar hook protein FlgE
MSFYTALTGLNGAQSDISATSNNIANVGTTGFKRSRAEFGDIFATSPLQNSSSSIGSGAILKGVKQQFTQGNIAASLNALDMAISGQGFFALKPSLTSTQVVYTRNGSFNVDNNRNVVDSSGQFLLAYPVNEDGSVTAKDIDSASPLRLPVTSGDPQATSNVDLAVNLPASAPVVTEKERYANGYAFDPNDPESFTNSTSFTIFDDLGNPTIATVYFIKTQRATAEDATNKFETRLVINDEVVVPDLVPAVNDSNQQIYIDQFGNQTTAVPDPSYFDTGRSSPLYKLDDIRTRVPSEPAALSGETAGFDFGEEGTRQIEIVTDPMLFGATYEADTANQGVYWGRDFLLVNIDDGTRPVSIDVRPGKYNAEQLAAEVERAINDAHDDARKVQIQQGADDTISIQLYTSDADGDTAVANSLDIDLLETSFVSTQANIDVANLTSPSFDLDVFLAHAQARINDALDGELTADSPAVPGIAGSQFAKLTSTTKLTEPPAMPQTFSFDYTSRDLGITINNAAEKWDIGYDEGQFTVTEVTGVIQSGDTTLTISIPDKSDIVVTIPEEIENEELTESDVLDLIDAAIEALFSVQVTGTAADYTYVATATGGTLTVNTLTVGSRTETFEVYGVTISVAVDSVTDNAASVAQNIKDAIEAADIDGVSVSVAAGVLTFVGPTLNTVASESDSETANTYESTQSRHLAYTNFGNRPEVVVYDRLNNVAESGASIVYDSEAENLAITMEATAGLKAGDTIVLMGAGSAGEALNGRSFIISTVEGNVVNIATGDLGLPDADISIETDENPFVVLSGKSTSVEAYFEGAALTVEGFATSFNNQRIVMRETDAARHSYTDADIISGGTDDEPRSIFGEFTAILEGTNPSASALGLSTAATKMAWVDDLDPPIAVVYDAETQSIRFDIDHTALGPGGSISSVSSIQVSSGNSDGVSGIGLLGLSAAPKVGISSATRVSGKAFIFDGPNQGEGADRFGASVQYDRDTGAFTFKSGTTGKEIDANKALGVTTDQLASNIQVGRYIIDQETGEAETGDGTIDLASRVLALGSSHVMGVGNGKNVGFVAGTGLKSQPARAVGAPANDPLNSEPVFLNPANFETTFNVSVNGVNSVIDIPGGNYIGSTLAEVLEKRINQMRDPDTGNTIGGVTVRYQPDDNNFVFTTGTTGADSTIRVKGSAKLGLDDVPLGIGSVPTIANLVQATNENGIPLFVNENGDIVDSEPDNLVTDYFPLYLDEGELTFDKTGKLTSPKGLTRYASQSDTFSISLDIDYSASSQLATPFVVNNLEQNGFTSGRLDGLSIDATGLLRANYTNGQNKPLGKLVLANFNNQNGLKQVGNATFVETASSGSAIIGEAGTEGFGSIQSGALERSNVDITEELVNLITAQRNFQAASKAIETSTQLTQTIINIRT